MDRPRSCFLAALLAAALIPAASLLAADAAAAPGLTLKQIEAIIDEASGDLALHHIRNLTLHHRWFVSNGYFDAAGYVRDRAVDAGLQEVRIERYPSDGKVYYSTDKSLPGWNVKSAALRMVAPVSRHLVSWAENPIVLASNSRSADVEAELVDVGEGVQPSDYQGKEVRGKLVLASAPQERGRIEAVHRLAVLERGAAGVVCYRSYYLDDFPDLVTWDHIWTLELDGRQSTFGFCVSKRMGWELKRLLQEGEKVTLRARVDAELSPGEYGIVTGHIPGTDPSGREVWFVAHLDHCRPSANDNASGSAAILETARALLSLTRSGLLPQPKRTLRFFWVPEINGSYALISRHLDEARRVAAVVNMDMVGENQELCGSVFRITRTPDSTPSFLNDVLRWNLDFLLGNEAQPGRELTDPLAVVSPSGTRSPWKAVVIPYSGGSDHQVFMGGVLNVPATMLGSWPDFFYHSSGDTPDKSDPTQLKRSVVYGIMTGYSIASIDAESGLDLVERMYPACLLRLQGATEEAASYLKGSALSAPDLREAIHKARWSHRRETRALQSVAALLPGLPAVAARIEKYTVELDRHLQSVEAGITGAYRDLCAKRGRNAEALPPLSTEERDAQRLIPVRNPSYPGPIAAEYVAEKLREQGRRFQDPFPGGTRYEVDAFIDGRLSVLDIRDAVSAENGPVRLADVLSYLETLSGIGLISFRKP